MDNTNPTLDPEPKAELPAGDPGTPAEPAAQAPPRPIEPATPAPALAGSCIRERLADSSDRHTRGLLQKPEVMKRIEEFERAQSVLGADDLRNNRLTGKLIKEGWHVVPFPGMKPDEFRLARAAKALGISRRRAETCVWLYTMCDEAKLEWMIKVGLSMPVLESLLRIKDPADRDVTLKAVLEGKLTREQLDRYAEKAEARYKRERLAKLQEGEKTPPAIPSPEGLLRMGDRVGELCHVTVESTKYLTGMLDIAVAQMQALRGDLRSASFEQRLGALKEIVAGFETVYALQFIVHGFAVFVTKRVPLPEPKNIVISPANQPPYSRLGEVWGYLLADPGYEFLGQTSARGVRSAAKAGKMLQNASIALTEHIRQLQERLEWAVRLPNGADGKFHPVRPKIHALMRRACYTMSTIPPKLNHAIYAILPQPTAPLLGQGRNRPADR